MIILIFFAALRTKKTFAIALWWENDFRLKVHQKPFVGHALPGPSGGTPLAWFGEGSAGIGRRHRGEGREKKVERKWKERNRK